MQIFEFGSRLRVKKVLTNPERFKKILYVRISSTSVMLLLGAERIGGFVKSASKSVKKCTFKILNPKP